MRHPRTLLSARQPRIEKEVVMKKKAKAFTLAMPTMASLVAGVRTGVRPGQVFRDKRHQSRSRCKVELRKQMERET